METTNTTTGKGETMTKDQAVEIADKFRTTGKFTSVSARQRGGEFAEPTDPWEVELWSVNARAGNRNLTTVKDYQPTLIKAVTRKALGKATKRDLETFARLAAERELDQE